VDSDGCFLRARITRPPRLRGWRGGCARGRLGSRWRLAWVALSGLQGVGGRGDPARCAGLTWFAPSGRKNTLLCVSPAVVEDRNLFRAEAQSPQSEQIPEFIRHKGDKNTKVVPKSPNRVPHRIHHRWFAPLGSIQTPHAGFSSPRLCALCASPLRISDQFSPARPLRGLEAQGSQRQT
jgi:hypothetical protein